MTEDTYIQILNIIESKLSNKKKADLIKEIFDKCNDDMLKLIIKCVRGE